MNMNVTGATAIRRREIVDDELWSGGGSTPAQPPAPTPRAQAQQDDDLAAAVRNAKPVGDGILYVGLNPGSNTTELAALRGATGGNVTAVMAHSGGKVDAKFGDFDLSKDGELQRFCDGAVAHYGLTAAQGDALEKLIGSVDATGKDEIARMALYFARAESGQGQMPPRLVLSGHSGGTRIWGETASKTEIAGFDFEHVRELGRIMPRAAAQVEDIHFAACGTSAQVEASTWQATFPNLKTMWGYSGYSPGAPVGHLLGWEARTRGRADDIAPGSVGAYTTPKGNVIAWSRQSEIVADVRIDVTAARALRDAADGRLDEYLSGQRAVSDPYSGTARDDYQTYQQFAPRQDITKAEKADAAAHAKVMLRVRFYETNVRRHFQAAHGAEVGRAFEALGLSAPDWTTLTRKEAMDQISDFRKAAGSPPRADVADASRHLDGLATLDPNAIPESWVS